MTNKQQNKSNVPNLRFPGFEGEWVERVLHELGDFVGGGTPSSINEVFWNGNIPWISSSDITENNINNIRFTRYITQEAIDESATKLCKAPVIAVVSRVGVGKIAHSRISLCTSQDFINIVNIRCNSLFLTYLLSKAMKTKASATQGTSIKGITTNEIKSIILSIPSNTEQDKIADLLALLDQRIATQNKIIGELKSLNNSLRENLFLRHIRFKSVDGSVNTDWQEMTLGDVGDIKMCRRIFNKETTSVGEVPFFKIGSFGKKADAYIPRELYEDYKKRFSFPKKGDILISAAGTIGRTVVYNGEDAYFQDSNIVWIDNDRSKVSNEFLFYVLQIVKYNTEGGTIQRLYNSILKSTRFTCPDLSEQNKIATFLSRLEQKIQLEKRILKGYVNQKQYFSRHLFI